MSGIGRSGDEQKNLAKLPETASYGFIPGLNGLRALSVLIVIIAHMGLEHIVPGGFGVTMFFFISGFLITRLLLAESEAKAKAGETLDLGKFYLRRLIRLYPALLFMLGITTGLYIILGYGAPAPMELAAGIGYFTNIYQVIARIAGELPFMPWTHLWSLAVEEHFYLAFPLLVILFRKNWRGLALALGAIMSLSVLWRAYIIFCTNLPVQDYNYMMTDARIDSLAWGCFLAVILHINGSVTRLKNFIGFIPTFLAFVGLGLSFVLRDEIFRYTLRFSVQGGAIFTLMFNLYYWRGFSFAFIILDWKPLAWIGSISYALYLWHVPVFDLFTRGFGESLIVRLIAVICSFFLAAFSFYYVEKPFLALRRKFGSHAGGITPMP
ncbi:MAG: acyltransferase [Robiginitomaculum sp.]